MVLTHRHEKNVDEPWKFDKVSGDQDGIFSLGFQGKSTDFTMQQRDVNGKTKSRVGDDPHLRKLAKSALGNDV